MDNKIHRKISFSFLIIPRRFLGKGLKENQSDLFNKFYKNILFNSKRNIDKFITETKQLLNTPSKVFLWNYLVQVLDEEHRSIFHKNVEFNFSETLDSQIKLNSSRKKYKSQYYLDNSRTLPRSGYEYNSLKKFKSTPSLENFHVTSPEDLVLKLSKQVGQKFFLLC